MTTSRVDRGDTASDDLFTPRGELSTALLGVLTDAGPSASDLVELGHHTLDNATDIVQDEDVQLTLFGLYCLAYGSLDQFGAAWEWSPELIRLRTSLEDAFEAALRERIVAPALPAARAADVAEALADLTAPSGKPGLAGFVAKQATLEQLREFLVQRSIYTLREADPHSWAIPRLTGRAKAALVEIQADEYGGGDPRRQHAAIFAQTVRGAGLSDRYGHYLDYVPAITLTAHNVMSMLGLNRRLRGAIVGHLAAFEMTSTIPSRLYGDGFRRHGFGPDVTWYFDEHVEADAVHEQIAAHDLAGSLAEDDPGLLPDIMFGAAACLTVEDWAGQHILEAWQAGRSSLRLPLAEAA
ncbi:iron-containing redox enzyme family protein [Ruania halotolerans]|uniref:iron-containing redox enzyme family protein n=1 Tax=Ruania halotolerans TaxID=2897773 RepID=UPI001E3EFFDB|nr:iron-containing redox enzyme family protein [Ruania halotolerans]UFU07917.1 iron-containing redox enzyme family protein [Ruania halotolerans]